MRRRDEPSLYVTPSRTLKVYTLPVESTSHDTARSGAMSTHVVVLYCRMPGYMWTMYDNSATEVLRCGSVCPRSKPARGMRVPPGIACCPVGVGSGRRCWATAAIAVGTAGACERSGAGTACYGAWAACGAAAPHAAMNSATRAIPNNQNETFELHCVILQSQILMVVAPLRRYRPCH